MTKELLITIICAILASPLLTKVVDYIINKLSNKQTQLDRIETSLNTVKKDLDLAKVEECRTNLMLLLHAFRNSTEIQVLGKKYIKEYDGDSYIIPLLIDWYDEKNLAYPDWLKAAYDKHHYELDDK